MGKQVYFAYLSRMFRVTKIGGYCWPDVNQSTGTALPETDTAVTGSELYKQIGGMNWKQREPIIIGEILNGNVPGFKGWCRCIQLADSTNR